MCVVMCTCEKKLTQMVDFDKLNNVHFVWKST